MRGPDYDYVMVGKTLECPALVGTEVVYMYKA
jgi:hypothetical protein